MTKFKKIFTFLGSCTLLSFLCVGCSSQATTSDTDSLEIETNVIDSDQLEKDAPEDIISSETIPEKIQTESENGFIIPDYEYDEYLTVSAEDNTPVLGYNIPTGWTSENKGVWATISKAGITEESFNVMFNKMSQIMLSEIESSEDFVATEHQAVDTPIGTFRIFSLDYIEDNHMDAQYAIMPVTEEKGVTVSFSYSDNWPHYYLDSLELLLKELFGEKQKPIEIPDTYEHYLHSYVGEKILGVNTIAGYSCSSSSTSDYLSFYSDTSSSIGIYEYDTIAPIYCGRTDKLIHSWTPDTNEINYIYYTEKGTCETPYGTAKLFDTKIEWSPDALSTYSTDYSEVAILRLNGSYIMIKYTEIGTEVPTNNIKTLLSELF